MLEFPDPKSPPSRMDKLAMGEDCCRHKLLGCVLANNGTPPGEQARSYLHSIWNAAEVSFVTGETEDERQWRLAKIRAELREWFRRLEEWEKTPLSRPPPPTPRLTAASNAEVKKLEKLRVVRRDEVAAAAALTERQGKMTH
jgi:hypothetical protein